MAKFVILCCLIALWSASVTARPTDEETTNMCKEAKIPMIYSPVCGKDKITGEIKSFASIYCIHSENAYYGGHYEVMKEGLCEKSS